MKRDIETKHAANVCAAVDTASDYDFGNSNNESGFPVAEEEAATREVAADAGVVNHDVAGAKSADNEGLANNSYTSKEAMEGDDAADDNSSFLDNYDLVDPEGDKEDPIVTAIDHYIESTFVEQSERLVSEQDVW